MALDIKLCFLRQLKVLEKMSLPHNQYVVWGSGPLAIRAIRESKDIDLLVPKQLWNQLTQIYPASSEKMIRIGDIEIWNDCLNLTHKIDEIIAHPDVIEGFPFMTLIDTIQWKAFMNRDKDLKDIALIEQHLKMKT